MAEVDYLPFATGGSANVVTQATYASAAWLLTGFVPGLAESAEANKVWRQASMVAAAIANFISNELGIAVLDDGDLASLIANFTSAIGQVARNARVVTSSAPLNLAISDYRVGLNRAVAPMAMAVTLPASPFNGQEIVLDDLAGNFNPYPITVSPASTPAGQTMSGGRPNYVLDEDFGAGVFAYFSASNSWSIRAT